MSTENFDFGTVGRPLALVGTGLSRQNCTENNKLFKIQAVELDLLLKNTISSIENKNTKYQIFLSLLLSVLFCYLPVVEKTQNCCYFVSAACNYCYLHSALLPYSYYYF